MTATVLVVILVVVAAFSVLLIFLIKLIRRVREIEGQVGNVVPYWRGVQAKLITDLTHPHEAAERVDELLRRLQANPEVEMSAEDRQELLDGLKRRAEGDDPKIDEEERRKAALFPMVMEEVQKEAANPNPITNVQLLGVKEPIKEE